VDRIVSAFDPNKHLIEDTAAKVFAHGEGLHRSRAHRLLIVRQPCLSVLEPADNLKEDGLQVYVRDNNVDQALRALKRKMQREGVFREMKQRRFYEKPSERTAREKSEAIRRARKLARKQAQREGLIPMPAKKALKEGRQIGRGSPQTHR
jgi:small subunit ribosomal protein S21